MFRDKSLKNVEYVDFDHVGKKWTAILFNNGTEIYCGQYRYFKIDKRIDDKEILEALTCAWQNGFLSGQEKYKDFVKEKIHDFLGR